MIRVTILLEEVGTDDDKRTTMTEVISDQEIKLVWRPKELLRLQLLKMVGRIIEGMQIGE